MRKCIFMFLFLLCFFNLFLCQRSTRTDSDKILVATSVFPVYDIVRNICGDKLNVLFVVPIGANPHTYEPVPSFVRELQKVDLYFGIHPEFDGWIKDYLPGAATLTFFKDRHREGEDDVHDVELSHHEGHEGEGHVHQENPHIWLSVKNARTMTERVTDELSSLDKNNRNFYQRNRDAYIHKLNRLDEEINTLFSTVRTKKFIQWHPAWDYFAEDYGLDIVGTIESGHGDEPSVKAFKSLIEKAKEETVRVIVLGLNLQSRAAETLENEIDGRLVRLDTIGNPEIQEKSSYLKMMTYNAKILSDELNGVE